MYLDSMRTSDGIQINGATVHPEVPVDSEKPTWMHEAGDPILVWRWGGTHLCDIDSDFGSWRYTSEAAAIAYRHKHRNCQWMTRDQPFQETLDAALERARSLGNVLRIVDESLRVIEVYR